MTADPRARRQPESILADDLRVDTRAQPDDAARIDRMVGGAIAASAGVGALWLLLRSIVSSKIVMVALATATVTAATAWVISRPSEMVVTAAAIETGAKAAPQDRGAVVGPAVVPTTPPAAMPTAMPTAMPDASTTRADELEQQAAERTKPRVRAALPPPSTAEQGADALLEQAARARNDGRTDDAVALYRELGRRFAGTREDGVGCVALGRLLQPRDSKGALAVFDRCLADHPRGDLVETALVGRAEALAKLGRVAEERTAWSELLRRFPSTLHAEHAKARIAGAE